MDVFELPMDTVQLIGPIWTALSTMCLICGIGIIAASVKVCQSRLYLHGFYPNRGGIYEYITDPFYYGKALFVLGLAIHNASYMGVLIAGYIYGLSNVGIAVIEKKAISAWISEIKKRK